MAKWNAENIASTENGVVLIWMDDQCSRPEALIGGARPGRLNQGQRLRGWWWPKQATCIQPRAILSVAAGYKNRTRYSMIGEILLTRDFISCPDVGEWSIEQDPVELMSAI
ncbi:hypothetical protein V8C35DRAFT_285224 [Trichoderma chlorosporum]